VALAFGRVYQGRPATLRLLAFGALSGVVAWAFERRSLLLATIASSALLGIFLGWLVFPDSLRWALPTLETLRQAGAAAAEVGSEARARVSPAEPVLPLVFAGATAVWAAVFSCHSLAFRAGSPLLALVPPAALVAFADSVLEDSPEPVFGLWFLAAALSVVFADSLRRIQGWGPVWSSRGSRNRLLPAAGRGGRRITIATIAVAALAPFLVPGYGSRAVIDLSSAGGDDRIRVSPLVSVGSELTSGQPREVFVVRSEQKSYWRMTSLETFDGVAWKMTDEEANAVVPGAPLGPSLGSGQVKATFTASGDLGFPWVPSPYRPSAVGFGGDMTWSPRSQTLTVGEPLSEGDSYTVTASFARPSVAELRAEDPTGLAAYRDLYPDLVGLPEDLPEQIGDLARQWTVGADTTYDQVMAIQSHLTDPGTFRYSTQVSFSEDSESLLDFLTTSRKGFCQQFASAMAVMLRALGIPARIAVGFTPGKSFGDGNSFRVTTENLHAWVEVYFPSYGWLPFEPTPGRTNPASESYMPQDETSGQTPTCPRRSPRCENQTGDGLPNTPPPGVDVGPGSEGGGDSTPVRSGVGLPLVMACLVVSLILVLACVPLLRRIRRRVALERAGPDPRRQILTTYRVFLDSTKDLGLGRSPGETPSEFADRVRRSGRLSDGHLDRLTKLAVLAAYSAKDPSDDDALDARADAQEALEELRTSTPLRRRLLGAYLRR
jgi:transglutaminase-like putative cysteine protease